MRAGVLYGTRFARGWVSHAPHLSFRISRYGVTRTSLGITLRLTAGGLPRYEPVLGRLSRGGGASWYLPDKEFRYLRHVVTSAIPDG